MFDLATVSPYVPGAIRQHADAQRSAIDRFLGRHPEYRRLPADVLVQYASTYRGDSEHVLEQDFRDNAVLEGARVDYQRPERPDWDTFPTSDDEAFQ